MEATLTHKGRASVAAYRHRSAKEVESRLKELSEEWDIERAIQLNAASLSLLGLGLGATVSRKFLLLPAAVGAFLLQHAISKWCPPLPLLCKLGFRTSHDIEEERYALRVLRGDFSEITPGEVDQHTKERFAERVFRRE